MCSLLKCSFGGQSGQRTATNLKKLETMKFQQVKSLQRAYGYEELQKMIDTGMAWHMEGSYGRMAMDALRSGACMLARTSRKDAYGNTIPSRFQVQKGTAGSYANSVRFYSDIDELTYRD